MISIDPAELSTPDVQRWLQGMVAPRPIAFASTLDAQGRPNLSPFSFFNVFSSNPPILVFSPARRVRDNTLKHTLLNCQATGEVVINTVNYAMVQQASLASCEYPEGVDEFVKAGFTPLPSLKVRPFRVAESPVAAECKVVDIISLGNEGGAGNMIVCHVVQFHIDERILDEHGHIDPYKIDLVARLGGDWYARAQGDALFEVPKPARKLGIGVDALPRVIRESYILTGNDLGMLGNIETLPEDEAVEAYATHPRVSEIFEGSADGLEARERLHRYAAELLSESKVEEAWKALLCDKLNRLQS
ncbi:flavin reductase family protein [bacterium]|nr:flavin reductase family protein [bacterium]